MGIYIISTKVYELYAQFVELIPWYLWLTGTQNGIYQAARAVSAVVHSPGQSVAAPWVVNRQG